MERCATSFLKWADGYSAELVIVDNGSTDGTAEWLDELQRSEPRVRVIHYDHSIGEGAAKNTALYQALGKNAIMVDTSVEDLRRQLEIHRTLVGR